MGLSLGIAHLRDCCGLLPVGAAEHPEAPQPPPVRGEVGQEQEAEPKAEA